MKFLNSFLRAGSFLNFKRTSRPKKQVERNIEIIGEAVNRIQNYKHADIKIINASKIIGTRNRIAHEYDHISDEIIWAIVIRELPKLKEEMIQLRA